MEIKAIRGFNDILPEEIGKWHFVEDTARDIFEGFGFSELRIPVIERTELFTRGIGEATDIVEKEMYTFIDKGGNCLTLRPEATASMARAYLEHQMYSFDPVAKVYFMGPMFRYERPRKVATVSFIRLTQRCSAWTTPWSMPKSLSCSCISCER